MPRLGHAIVAPEVLRKRPLDVIPMNSIYREEIGAMLDAIGICIPRFAVGAGAQG